MAKKGDSQVAIDKVFVSGVFHEKSEWFLYAEEVLWP
jgi:hypothetical protein